MFAHDSIWHNVVGALCRPMTASSGIRARKWATTDSHQWYALVSTFSVE